MVQMECVKQSTHRIGSWSPRVLTMDRQSGTLTISRHQHPTDVFYHTLLPSAVQTWPHFSLEMLNDDYYSNEAKLTLCIFGTTAAVPDVAAEEVAVVGIPLPSSHAGMAALSGTSFPPPSLPPAAAYTPLTAVAVNNTSAAVATRVTNRSRREKPGKFDAWVLRFTSKAPYNVAVQALAQLPGVKFSKKENLPGVGTCTKEVPFSAGALGALSVTTVPSHRSRRRGSAFQ
ncbi:hypothetical protein ABB37_09128 [Leptomonas pyrrhocoris]|uniref:Uncharacterized protein n=1 Tax=Leptomonas pyrrhocoris TaxID=157538 RepID=A0A0M9FRC6_LEPPY|nr:hypothetical protein ABB37_09128 [Leptomonas pyrrhocoris]XP_015652877.1 hypothetical protein ABB37_09128 [Leptomonas pyrrhocoris]XP_015652878.1 hypothetical protein ABB37_09128 [Leptomonas pyrrhocoris]XP_015652879.1 hypothetical protein ABB37_09128 [Leptomonas pyrrhocoris]KPA74437.1 hypothetical protein ABB37_09128 [Leptomonas pyrrhocoris]KPA74438.1 hypothetical protein ABB37_09128 [Leptomonas pyrrhocoris]KPA74439.1 hypothetical protein ABB37_09128 [Leptomonas pyrrhocoris]KPA74440.1 hypot|eukprot:XP_015652876.1 hypothetical protein ABB37_09128 [Leptomonas pyrrhocoris]